MTESLPEERLRCYIGLNPDIRGGLISKMATSRNTKEYDSPVDTIQTCRQTEQQIASDTCSYRMKQEIAYIGFYYGGVSSQLQVTAIHVCVPDANTTLQHFYAQKGTLFISWVHDSV